MSRQMKKFYNIRHLVPIALFLTLSLSQAATILTGFTRHTANSPTDVASQFTLEVWDENEPGVGPGEVLFKFTNAGPVTSTISQIYWDDRAGVLTGSPVFSTDAAHTADGAGSSAPVTFVFNASSVKPPGGLPDWPQNTTDFRFDADPVASQNGVEEGGEMAGFLFDLAPGKTLADIEAAINAPSPNNLRVAFHAQGIGTSADSDVFINTNVVPEPSSTLLLLLTTPLLLRRRRN